MYSNLHPRKGENLTRARCEQRARQHDQKMDLCELLTAAVNRHPWEIARVSALRAILQSYGVFDQVEKILDVGCGDGYGISEIVKTGNLTADAVDSSMTEEQATSFSEKYGSCRFHRSLDDLSPASYGLVTILDVIEHNENDTGFLKTVIPYAAPKAHILLTAPAFNSLFSSHDTFLNHFRRYNMYELTACASRAGLDIVAAGYLFPSLLLMRFTMNLVRKIPLVSSGAQPKGVSQWSHGSVLTRMVTSWLQAENYIALALNRRGMQIPGLSVWALTQKPQL